MQGLDRTLVLAAQAECSEVVVEAFEEPGGVVLATGDRRIRARFLVSRQQQLETMVAGVADPVEPDQRSRVGGLAAGDAADQAEALGEPGEHLARPLWDRRVLGPLDDRGQGAVDVGQDRRSRGPFAQGAEQRGPGAVPGLKFLRHEA